MTNEKDLTFDGFKGAASLFTYEKDVQAKSGIFIFWYFYWPKGSEWVFRYCYWL